MPVSCLAFHSSWQCQHAGACCNAGWAIPVEGPAFERLLVRFGHRSDVDPRFVTGGPLPEGAAAVLATRQNGACVFYGHRLCTIHSELGPTALPIACQQFPRIALHDSRGTFVTLSHFCPTAARLLLNSGRIQPIAAPASLASPQPLEGLDAVHALPPLLSPRVLTDLDGYDEWERQCLQILSNESLSAEQAVDSIEAGTRRLIEWRPGRGSLTCRVREVFTDAASSESRWTRTDDERRFRMACAAVPRGLAAARLPEHSGAEELVPGWWPEKAGAARRFVAAHLFGNWVAYHGRSLQTIVEALKISLSVLRVEAHRSEAMHAAETGETGFVEAARRADLLLVHLVDVKSLVLSIETRAIP